MLFLKFHRGIFLFPGSTIDYLKMKAPSDFSEQSQRSILPVPETYRACFDLFEILQMAPRLFCKPLVISKTNF